MTEKTQYNKESAMFAASLTGFSREELEMMLVSYFDVIWQIRSLAGLENEMLYELPSKIAEAQKERDGFHFMIKNKYMFWEEFDRVEIKDQQGNLKGYGKDHISAIDNAMEKEQ